MQNYFKGGSIMNPPTDNGDFLTFQRQTLDKTFGRTGRRNERKRRSLRIEPIRERTWQICLT